MASRDKDPFALRKAWDDFLIKPLGTALLIGIGGATAFATGGSALLFIAGGLATLNAWTSQKVDVPAMMAEKNKKRHLPGKHPVSQMIKKLSKQAGLENEPRCIMVPGRAYGVGKVPFAGTIGTPSSSVILISRGIEKSMTPAELNAVLAHEIIHIKNSDTELGVLQGSFAQMAMISVFYTSAAAVLALLGFASLPALATTTALTAFGGVAATFVTQAAISRARERRADRGSAALTKNPWALASALGRIVELQLDTLKMKNRQRPGAFGRFMIRVFRSHPKTKHRRNTLASIGEELIKQDPDLAKVKNRAIAEVKIFEEMNKIQRHHKGHNEAPPNDFDDSDNLHKICESPPAYLPFNEAAREQDNSPTSEEPDSQFKPPRFNHS